MFRLEGVIEPLDSDRFLAEYYGGTDNVRLLAWGRGILYSGLYPDLGTLGFFCGGSGYGYYLLAAY